MDIDLNHLPDEAPPPAAPNLIKWLFRTSAERIQDRVERQLKADRVEKAKFDIAVAATCRFPHLGKASVTHWNVQKQAIAVTFQKKRKRKFFFPATDTYVISFNGDCVDIIKAGSFVSTPKDNKYARQLRDIIHRNSAGFFDLPPLSQPLTDTLHEYNAYQPPEETHERWHLSAPAHLKTVDHKILSGRYFDLHNFPDWFGTLTWAALCDLWKGCPAKTVWHAARLEVAKGLIGRKIMSDRILGNGEVTIDEFDPANERVSIRYRKFPSAQTLHFFLLTSNGSYWGWDGSSNPVAAKSDRVIVSQLRKIINDRTPYRMELCAVPPAKGPHP